LRGTIKISKSKNSYLPILTGVLLNENPVRLKNLPDLRDIKTILKLLENLGVRISKEGEFTSLDASRINSFEALYEMVKTMRASILVLGPLLGRFRQAKVSLPGGCAIGTRPIDIHLSNLEKMGAVISLEGGYVEAKTQGLKGANLVLSFPSVGATENLLMAAVFAEGETVIENAALEPEIVDLGQFLISMGAKISGLGTSKIHIQGVSRLRETTYEAIGDRIEALTYIMAALITSSPVTVTGFDPTHLDAVLNGLKDMGADLLIGPDFVEVKPSELRAVQIETTPFPGFPTDAQAQLMALATQARGSTIITEKIFENRFMHVPELQRLGAQITLKGNTAIVEGKSRLKGAPVMCTDLRASAALVLAGLSAHGETRIDRVYHLDRGYEKMEEKLSQLGAKIRRIK
jgi:UDP-N-acetylglucosamine 1-carboxyvinyltransferase